MRGQFDATSLQSIRVTRGRAGSAAANVAAHENRMSVTAANRKQVPRDCSFAEPKRTVLATALTENEPPKKCAKRLPSFCFVWVRVFRLPGIFVLKVGWCVVQWALSWDLFGRILAFRLLAIRISGFHGV